MSITKRKLLIVLGAGSSIPCGMPTLTQLDEKMKTWSGEWRDEPALPHGTERGIFNDLWEIVDEYYRQNNRPRLGLRANFEKILGEMTALASWVTPSPFGNALVAAVREGTPSDKFTWAHGHSEPYFYRQLIIAQASFLMTKLAEYVRQRSAALDVNSSAYAAYKQFFSRLRDEFEVGIYTLNYDDIAWRSWPDAFTGFSGGKFDARQVSSRPDWAFIYHLHGSVHYSFRDSPSDRSVEWKDDLNDTFKTCELAFPSMAAEFKPIVPSTLIAGGFKLDQLLADPAQTFHATLVRHAHEADCILIIGYGFGDVHVNRAMQNRLDLSPYDPRGRPPALVIDKSDPSVSTTSLRQGHEYWAWELTHTLNTRFHLGSPPSNTRPTVGSLIQNNELEQDMTGRNAIWHGGFLKAIDCFDQIVLWLRR